MHGEQERAAYNGHFGGVCYHPLFVFNQFGDCEGAKLRPGNVRSASDGFIVEDADFVANLFRQLGAVGDEVTN